MSDHNEGETPEGAMGEGARTARFLRLPLRADESRVAYLLRDRPKECGLLIGPCGARESATLLGALGELGGAASLAAVLLDGLGPEAAAGTHRLEAAGFRGEILVRSAALETAEAYGFLNPLRPVEGGGGRFSLPGGRELKLFSSALPRPHGTLLALDTATGVLFSGARFDAPDSGDPGGSGSEPFLLGLLAELARKGELRAIAPRGGPCLETDVAAFLERFGAAEALIAKSCAEGEGMTEELAAVERSLAVDPVTRLKNQRFLHSFLGDRLRANDGRLGAALHFATLDGLVEINRELGREGGDEALRDLAYIVANEAAHLPGAVAFKLNSPTIVLMEPGADRDAAAATAERLRLAIRQSEIHRQPLRASIGLVHADELTGQGEEAIKRFERTGVIRNSLASERGGDTVCDVSTERDEERHFSKRVVLVEPELAHAAFLAGRLEALGFRVASFADGRSALDRIIEAGCDLVVSEAMAPRMSGFQLRESLMADSARSRIPFVLVSHRKDDEYLAKAAALRVVHYLKKPYALAELLGLAENLTKG